MLHEQMELPTSTTTTLSSSTATHRWTKAGGQMTCDGPPCACWLQLLLPLSSASLLSVREDWEQEKKREHMSAQQPCYARVPCARIDPSHTRAVVTHAIVRVKHLLRKRRFSAIFVEEGMSSSRAEAALLHVKIASLHGKLHAETKAVSQRALLALSHFESALQPNRPLQRFLARSQPHSRS